VTAAWNRIPASRTLGQAYTIVLEPGRWSATQTPNYWQSRWGSASAPVELRAARAGSATLPAVNMFDVRWLRITGVRFRDRFDLFHCERCDHLTIDHSRFDGSQQLLDTVKFNQSTWIFLRHDRITGASQNALQFVAVQHGAVTDSELAQSGDWCAYFKGGSTDLTITGNRAHDCGTGGLLAGQGSGLQFMVAPFFRYEAYRMVIAGNWVWRTHGAGIGVNGGDQIALVNNCLWDTGAASHTVEIDFSLRTCDGHPGDPGRERCAQYLSQGAWGTTRVDHGSNQVRIPNRDIVVAGNDRQPPPPGRRVARHPGAVRRPRPGRVRAGHRPHRRRAAHLRQPVRGGTRASGRHRQLPSRRLPSSPLSQHGHRAGEPVPRSCPGRPHAAQVLATGADPHVRRQLTI